jgi:hypothetical protein
MTITATAAQIIEMSENGTIDSQSLWIGDGTTTPTPFANFAIGYLFFDELDGLDPNREITLTSCD